MRAINARMILALLPLLFMASLPAIDWPIVYVSLTEEPSTSMTISWISEAHDINDTISYRSDSEKSSKAQAGWQSKTGIHTVLQTYIHSVHHVTLHHLKADTKYRFRIPNSSKVYTFKTVPDKPPIAFVTGGDTNQSGLAKFKQTAKIAAATNPHFVVLGGDLAYACRGKGGTENYNEWLLWLEAYSKTMTYNKRLIPLAVTIGNHDAIYGGFDRTPEDALTFYSLFPILRQRGYNTLRITDWLSIYLLDSGHTNSIDGKQCQWLRKQLAADQETINRFAVYHIPAYPIKSKALCTQAKKIRKHWVPLFEIFGLHLAFENHEHTYKRTLAITAGSEEPGGIIYIGGGAWGVQPRKTTDNPSYLAFTKNSSHFLQVILEQNHRIVLARSPDGSIIDMISSEY